MKQPRPPRGVIVWLVTGAVLVAAMVVVGGVTRLTGSGLSITEWKVVTGVVPPLNHGDWVALFEKYQATPQFQQINHRFTLSDFQGIFWWEYAHRLLGRAIGFVFLIPFLWFWRRGVLNPPLMRRLLVLFGLGAFQGFLGWFMVASGLGQNPAVSHFRLAAHLLTAFLTLAVIGWTILDLAAAAATGMKDPSPPLTVRPGDRRMAWLLALAVVLQFTYGAFVAGLRAGFIFNTFPAMGAGWIPPGLGLELLHDPVTIQFVHRWLGAGVLLLALGVMAREIPAGPSPRRRAALGTGGAILGQFLLGVATILWLPRHPVLLGATHQAGAVVVLIALTAYLQSLYRGWTAPAAGDVVPAA